MCQYIFNTDNFDQLFGRNLLLCKQNVKVDHLIQLIGRNIFHNGLNGRNQIDIVDQLLNIQIVTVNSCLVAANQLNSTGQTDKVKYFKEVYILFGKKRCVVCIQHSDLCSLHIDDIFDTQQICELQFVNPTVCQEQRGSNECSAQHSLIVNANNGIAYNFNIIRNHEIGFDISLKIGFYRSGINTFLNFIDVASFDLLVDLVNGFGIVNNVLCLNYRI